MVYANCSLDAWSAGTNLELSVIRFVRLRRPIDDGVEQEPDRRGPNHPEAGFKIEEDHITRVNRFVNQSRGTAEQLLCVTLPEKPTDFQLVALKGQNVGACFARLEEDVPLDKEGKCIGIIPDR